MKTPSMILFYFFFFLTILPLQDKIWSTIPVHFLYIYFCQYGRTWSNWLFAFVYSCNDSAQNLSSFQKLFVFLRSSQLWILKSLCFSRFLQILCSKISTHLRHIRFHCSWGTMIRWRRFPRKSESHAWSNLFLNRLVM